MGPPRRRYKAVRESLAALGGVEYVPDRGFVIVPDLQQFNVTPDHHQQVIQIMGDPAHQLADDFESLRLQQLLVFC